MARLKLSLLAVSYLDVNSLNTDIFLLGEVPALSERNAWVAISVIFSVDCGSLTSAGAATGRSDGSPDSAS